MDNPFKKRRTELVSDRRTMLSLVSPTPIEEFFREDREELIEKLTLVVGTPGCGKTTIAQVVEFESLATLCFATGNAINKDLVDVLTVNRLIKDEMPAILGHRLSMTTNFRDVWELPYEESTRTALLRAFVQAKSVLGWFRQLEAMGIPPEDIEIVMGANAESVVTVTGADDPMKFRQYARDIELSIFRIVTSLVPPEERDLPHRSLNTRYDVFEVLQGIRILRWRSSPERPGVLLRPMMIIDDAHELHPVQFIQLRDWLKSKAIGVSRWLLCRPDVVSPEDYRDALTKDAVAEGASAPGSSRGRDYLIKLMQLASTREKRFRLIARDIANRYIQGIPEFTRRGIRDLAGMLDQAVTPISDGQLKQLREQVDKLIKESKFAPTLVDMLRSRIPATARPDEALATLRILIHRERNRTPQLGLLPDDEEHEEPVTVDKTVAPSLIEGARIQLLHEFDRPYYHGMEKLTAASNINIEQFIKLGGSLVDEVLARVIRDKPSDLAPKAQHTALVLQARQTMKDWDFPYNVLVRNLVNVMANACVERTKRPNAPLDDGANAFGVPQDEMDQVLAKHERLARILHFAFAYRALVFVPQYHCKGKVWCLLELGAVPCMSYGLTLRRGGFIESTLSKVQGLLPEVASV